MDKLKYPTVECKENFYQFMYYKWQGEINPEEKFLHWNRLVGKQKKKIPKGGHVLIEI